MENCCSPYAAKAVVAIESSIHNDRIIDNVFFIFVYLFSLILYSYGIITIILSLEFSSSKLTLASAVKIM